MLDDGEVIWIESSGHLIGETREDKRRRAALAKLTSEERTLLGLS